MLYYLFDYLDRIYDMPGAGLFQFITFRAAMTAILSLFIATYFGRRIIAFLQRKQVGESIRDLGLEGQNEKAGTPTMGGIIIILDHYSSLALRSTRQYLCHIVDRHDPLDGGYWIH